MKKKSVKFILILLPALALISLNSVEAQHKLTASAHYGMAAEYFSFPGKFDDGFVPESYFTSRHQTNVRLDYSESRMHLRLGYVYWKSELDMTFKQIGRFDPVLTRWSMNCHALETGAGFSLILTDKLQWNIHGSIITPYFFTEKEITKFNGIPVKEKATQDVDFVEKQSAYRFTNEIEVKLSRRFSISQEISVQYHPRYIQYRENPANQVYFIQGSIGLKWIIWDSERKTEVGK